MTGDDGIRDTCAQAPRAVNHADRRRTVGLLGSDILIQEQPELTNESCL